MQNRGWIYMGAVVCIGRDCGVQSGVYSIPFDETEAGWDKQTVRYVMENQRTVRDWIRRYSKKYNMLDSDMDDISMEVYMYFCNHSDYDIGKAVERSKGNTVTPIDGYVNKCIEFIVKQFYNKRSKYMQHIVSDETKSADGDMVSLIELNSSSEDDTDSIQELEELCEMYESKRNVLGYDMFTLLYIQINLMMFDTNFNDSDVDELLEIFDIKRDIAVKEDTTDLKNSIAKALSICMYEEHECGTDSVERAANIVRRFVYGSNQIDKAIYEFVLTH